MGVKPLDDWVLEIGKSVDERVVSGVTDIADVFSTGRYFGVFWEGENECLDGVRVS